MFERRHYELLAAWWSTWLDNPSVSPIEAQLVRTMYEDFKRLVPSNNFKESYFDMAALPYESVFNAK